MIVLTILLGAGTLILLLPTISDVISLARLSGARRRSAPDARYPLPRLLFLVPAHNEELLLGGCLHSLQQLAYPAELVSLVVIADNCADRTAEIAQGAGVRCLERTDTVRVGKPWAIAWALDQLPLSDHDAVVVIDADAIVEPDFARELAAASPLTGKAVQPFNGVSNREEHALTRLAAVFAVCRFRFMNVLKQRTGLNVPLANGLCLGTSVLATHGWGAFSICEDWELYVLLTQHGVRIENLPGARVFSQEARSLHQSSTQRRRWSAGRMAILLNHFPALLSNRRIGMYQTLDCVAELTAPGPVAHVGVAALLAIVALIFRPPGALWLCLALLASTLRYVIYTLAALLLDPQPGKALLAFAYLPIYAVWRLGIQLATFTRIGTQSWVRTRRHAQPIDAG